jgi:ABC-2 type transport system ATP-binding protein
MTISPAITLRGVAKRYRKSGRGKNQWWLPWWKRTRSEKVALHALDMDIEAGAVTGIIGPNGSGKSTLIRILSTLLLPDTGTATVFGFDVEREAAEIQRLINRVSVEASFFKELTPWENLIYAARLYGRSGSGTRDRVAAIFAELGLKADVLDQPMKELSRGQQQKIAIARSFLTAPSLLLMDEPTTGLDPRSKRDVQDLLTKLRAERSVTVLLCTHDLQEAEALCDRVVMLDEGRVIADGTPAELCRRYGGEEAISLEEVFLRLTGKSLDDDEEAPE